LTNVRDRPNTPEIQTPEPVDVGAHGEEPLLSIFNSYWNIPIGRVG